MTPLNELLNAFEFEFAAERKLDPATFRLIAGSDRRPFDRITFRPRLMVNTIALDLSIDLFGDKLFTPIIVGPIADQKRFHAEGEVAMARGASAAKAAMVLPCRSSCAIDQIAAQAKTPLWYQVDPGPEMTAKAQDAVKAGCKVVCMTGDWKSIVAMRSSIGVPLVLKGIMSARDAKTAVERGAQGIIVSNYTGHETQGMAATMDVLPSIVDAVAGKVQVLVDGGFRRGSDVLKALALGARAVMIGRPMAWALAAYGAEGVQRLTELLQNELARDMAMCGRVNLAAIDPTMIKVHRA